MQLIKILTADAQKNLDIYESIIKFFKILLETETWIKDYIFWELELFNYCWLYLEFKNLVDKDLKDDKIIYKVKSSSSN